MSAFVVLFNVDGSPADRVLLEEMTATLGERGPDAQKSWCSGPIGLGHALLRTTWEAEYEAQPLSFGDDVWLVADARIDGREDLWRKLGQPDHARLAQTADSALILYAYLKWGEQCVDHLIGDFSFVIWDGRKRWLFGAKDPFGVRLLYYARVGNTWVISNVLECIRLHPAVSDRLNEPAVIDFLLCDGNQELDTTFFAAIAKLPSAHCFTVVHGTFASRRYWTTPEPELLWLKKDEEYIEGFRALLAQATSDRLRTAKAAIWFSGGLDSTNLAATALEAGRKRGRPIDLKAITVVYDRLIPDRERHFASVAAAALGIPIEFVVADGIPLFEAWDQADRRMPEPRAGGLGGVNSRTFQLAARGQRVVLYGEGADEILPTWSVNQLRGKLPSFELWRCVLGSMFGHRQLPPLGTGIVAAWRNRKNRRETEANIPPWLAPRFREQSAVRERAGRLAHPDRLRSSGRCASRFYPAAWASVLEECADEGGRAHVDVVLPYLDLRLLEFALRIPPFPWSTNKYLLRRMGQGRLHQVILTRTKASVVGDPVGVRLPNAKAWQDLEERLIWSDEVDEFVSRAKVREVIASQPPDRSKWETLRPFSLAVWMQNGRKRKAPVARRA